MRILNIHKYYWPRDGASKYALQLAALLEEQGDEVVPFAMHASANLPTLYDRFFVSKVDLDDPRRVSLFKKIQSAGRIFYSWEACRKMVALLQENKIDVAHLHNIYHHVSPSILPVLKKRRIPIIMTMHDYKLLTPNYTMFHHGAVHEEDARGWYLSCVKNKCLKNSHSQSALVTAEMIWHHKIMRYYERYVDHFIAPSQFMLELCVKFGWPRAKFSYIPHPVEVLGGYNTIDGSYVAYVGRLSEEKGTDVLIEAAAKTPHIPYKIFGTGPDEDRLRALVRDNAVHNVTFEGFVTGVALNQAIGNARLLVVPSIWYENAPLSILEPMAMGKVVIGSRIGGIPELLPDKLLCPPGNSLEWARVITHWFEAPAAARAAMGQELQKQAKENHNSQVHVQRILELYKQLLPS